ncbi:MAG TPA: hypothetical protein DIW31_12540 [Bacteroidales bacterium]|nr:hypothetical protein [Bacteroidales bacterium]
MKRKPNNIRKIASIKGAITKHIKSSMGTVNPRYSLWYCGITNDTERRKAEHNVRKKDIKIEFWKSFNAGTMNDAQIIETEMFSKGMKNMPYKGGANVGSKNVYVFKMTPRGLEGIEDVISILFS